MFVRNAARTLALALGLVALLASASSAPAADETVAPAKKIVNINQASADELARLPRVGPSLAGKIVAHRQQHGTVQARGGPDGGERDRREDVRPPQAVPLRLRRDDADREGLLEGNAHAKGRVKDEGRRPRGEGRQVTDAARAGRAPPGPRPASLRDTRSDDR